MINKKSYMCLFIILILLMLGMSVVSAEDVDVTTQNHTTVTPTKTVSHEAAAETNIKNENNEKTNLIENTNTLTNTTNDNKKITKKIASQTENTKASEAPSTAGYKVYQIGSADQFTRKGTPAYYNLTNDIVFTNNYQGNDADGYSFLFNQNDNVVINGNGHTISYQGTRQMTFTRLYGQNAKLTLHNVTFKNYTNSAIYLYYQGTLKITDSVFINNSHVSGTGTEHGGGAIRATEISAAYQYARINVTNTVFLNNSAPRGGAIFTNDMMYINITNCYFEGNWAQNGTGGALNRGGGGAIYLEDGPTTQIINSEFVHNYQNQTDGSIRENNIDMYSTTGVTSCITGYNNKVNGVYITDVASSDYGIITQSGNTVNNSVYQYYLQTVDVAFNTTINKTTDILFTTTESGFGVEMDNIPLHVTITNPNGTIDTYELVTNDVGQAIIKDYKSEVAGTLTIEVSTDDVYNQVLRKRGNVVGVESELVYYGQTTTLTHIIYRLNTTTTCNESNFNSPARIFKDFTVTVKDSNGNPVTDGSVDLIVDGNVEDSAEVEDGHAYFHYAFTSAGTKNVIFIYSGTQLVYNSSQTSITATLTPIAPTLNVVAHNVHINQSANVEISLTYGDNLPAPYQKLTVIIGEDNHQEDVYTDINGRVTFTNYTFGEYRDSINVRVQYAGNYSAGFTSCSEGYDTYVNDKYSSHMTLRYDYENRIGTLTLTLKGENGEDITTSVKPRVIITADNDVRVDRSFDVVNGQSSITITEMLIHPVVQEALWLGNELYYPCTTDVVLTEATFPSKITINRPSTINVGEEFDILIELTTEDGTSPIDDADLYVSINGGQAVKHETNTNGHVNLAYTPSDNSTITIYAEFQGNPLFEPSDNTEVINGETINRIPTAMTIGVPQKVRVNHTFNFNVSLTDSRNSINTNIDKEPITVLVNNEEVTATFDLNRNVYIASYKPVDNTDIVINASYAGSNVYMPVNASNTQLDSSKIEKLGTRLVVSAAPSSTYATRPVTIHVLLTDADGTAITGRINLTINGTREEVDIGVDGITRTFTSSMPISDVLASAEYLGTGVYEQSSASTTFNVTQIPTITKVRVLNSTTGNVTLDVVVVTNTTDSYVVDEGQIIVDVGNFPTEYFDIASGTENTTFKLLANLVPTSNIGIHVSYSGTVLYQESEGVDYANIDNIFDHISVEYQNATLTLNVNESVHVGETVTIHGVLLDGFSEPIGYQDIQLVIKDSDDNQLTLDNNGILRTNNDGTYQYLLENAAYGTYTASVTFAGSQTVNQTTQTKDFTVKLIPTTTVVRIINNTVGNVTLEVSVTDAREGVTQNVTTGSIKVEYNENTTVIPVVSDKTIIPLNIPSTDSVSINLIYYDDSYVYDTSSDATFTSITADMDQAQLALSVTPVNVLTDNIRVSGKLVNGLGRGFSGTIHFTFNDTAYSHEDVTTSSDGTFSFDMPAVKLGNTTITATFNTVNNVILTASNTTSFNVIKIPTQTHIVIKEIEGDDEILGIRVQNNTLDYVTEGNVELVVDGVSIKTVSLSDYTYSVYDVDGNDYVFVTITEEELVEQGLTTANIATANYLGTNDYNTSAGSYDVSGIRNNAIIKVELNNSEAYINESVDVNITLTDEQGHAISGDVVLTIKDRVYNRHIAVTDGVARITIPYSNSTIGSYDITASLKPSALYYPTSNSTTLEIIRIPTVTLVSVIDDTWNKTRIKVEVFNNLTNEMIDYGQVEVYINNKNQTDNFYDVTGEPILVDIETVYTGRFEINVKYHENDYYQQSVGINKTTANITDDKFDSITIKSQRTNLTISTTSPVYVDDVLLINGTLYNRDTNEYIANQIIHIIVDGEEIGTNHTDSNGKYVYYYKATQNGTFIVQADFVAITNIAGNTTQAQFTVNKIDTTTIVSILNDTVGNVTLKVNVTDIIHDTPVTSGRLNITIDGESYNEIVTGAETIIKLDRIDSSKTYDVEVRFIEDDKYLPSRAIDKVTSSYLESINVVNQTATLTVTTDKESYLVGDTVIITGTLKDGLENNITGIDLEVTVDGKTDTASVDNGVYTLTYVTDRNGTINVTVKYAGNDTVNNQTANTTFNVEKINTTTIVKVLNNTVGNVTITVNVTGEDNKVVTDGDLLVTIAGKDPITGSVNATGDLTIITLNDIDTAGTYEISVKYLGNGTYNESTGIGEDGSEFNSIVTVLQDPLLSLTVPQNENYVLGNITIQGKLTDAKGNIIPGQQYVTLTFNNEETTEPIPVNVTTGEYSYTRETHFTGDVNVTVNFAGITDKFNAMHNESSYTIIKLPTETRVTIVNNTFGTANINVEVIDTHNNKNVSTGWLHVTFNDNLEIVNIISNVTNIPLNAPDANRYSINVLFNGTEYYDASTGILNQTGEKFDHIIVVKQNSTITLNANETIFVGDDVEIKGRVTDGLNKPIVDGEEISISITGSEGTIHRTAYTAGGNGAYSYHETINLEGEYTIRVDYGGNTTMNASHASRTFTTNKKNTITTMELVNSTVGNVTIKVEVTDFENNPITNGDVNISINGQNYTKTFDNAVTLIKLDEINSVDEVDIKVEYLGNYMYNPSSATDVNSGENNITFTPDARNSTVTINVYPTLTVIGDDVVISGRLHDSLGNDIENAPLRFEFCDGVNTEIVETETTDENGLYAYIRPTSLTGTIKVTVVYAGSDDGTINGCSKTVNYTINKIPTKSNIECTSYTEGNITYKIWFTPLVDTNTILKVGWFEIKANGSDNSRAFYYFNKSNDDQQFPITIDEDGYCYVQLPDEFFDPDYYAETGKPTYVFLTYHGNEIYGESSSSISELKDKGNLTVVIQLDKDSFKVNETVNVFIELVNSEGFRQNARVNITIGNTTYQNRMSTRADGLNITFTNSTGNEYTINVEYPGSGGWNPANGSRTFTIEKLETETLVNITSSTYGNLQIEVVVNDTDRNSIVTAGTLEVTYDSVIHNIPVSSTGKTLIDINVPEPGSSVPVTVYYLENPSYKPSLGVNASNTSQTFTHIIVEKQVANISVNVNHNDTLGERELYIGDSIIISGRLTNPLGIVSGKDVIITINGTTEHAITDENGYYEKIFERNALIYKGNGTFTVNVEYEGNESVAIATNRTNYTVYKIPTKTVALLTNNTAGNVTVNVTVYDSVSNNIINTGEVRFYNESGSLIALINLENANGTHLPIADAGEYTISATYMGNQKYLNSTAIDNDTKETFGPITIVNQVATITISLSNTSVILGESVTINGTVVNGLGEYIRGTDLVKISIGDDIYYANLTGNGQYKLTNVTTSIGLKEVIATFVGIEGIDETSTQKQTFMVNRIPTTTIVEVENSTVGNASINVRVLNSTGGNVTTGKLNVTVNGNPLDPIVITSGITNIKLESVTEMGEVIVNVEYLRNDIFDNSTGLDAKNIYSEENTTFTGFNTTRQLSVITVVTNTSSLKIGETVKITGTLYDDRNHAIDGTDIVNITIEGKSYLVSVREGSFELENITINSGNKTVIATYNGNDSINASNANTSFFVEKIPTTTNVTIVSNVVENFTVDVVVRDYHNITVKEGILEIYFNGQRSTVNVNTTSGVTRIYVPVTYARPNVAFTITYLENPTYLSSKGYRSTGEELTNITIIGQTPIIEVSAESSRFVDQNVRINGTLKDGLNRTLKHTEITVYVDGTNMKTITDENGKFNVTYVPNHEGEYNATVTYTGTGNIYGKSENASFTVYRIPTVTTVELLDNRVDNVTIKVVVTGDNKNVSIGKFNVTINDQNTTFNVTDNESIVKLDISTVDTFDVIVTYLDNYKYINSTGVNATGEEFNTITTSMLDSHISIETDVEIIRVGRNVTVTGVLTDDLGRAIPNAVVRLIFDDGINPPEENSNTTDADGKYSFTRNTHLTGEVNVTAIYDGNGNTINATNNSIKYNVNKLPTQTRVTVLNYTRTNVTLQIVFEDTINLVEIIDGKFNVTINEVYVDEYSIGDYLEDGKIIYKVPESFLTEDYDTALICFVEDDTYLASNTTVSGNLIKLPTKINITLTRNESYINQAFDITIKLMANDQAISGNVTYQITGGEEVKVFVPEEGITIHDYAFAVAGLKNITAKFAENRTCYASSNITKFVITKLPTTTNVSILNDTVGNARIKVVVNDTFNNEIVTTGNLSITLGDDVFNVEIKGEETIIPLNVTKKDTLLTVNYVENDNYQSSRGLDNNTGEVLVGINVKSQIPTMTITNNGDNYVGYIVTIEGDLKDGLNKEIVGRQITVTVNGTTLINYTDSEGHYVVYYHADRNGTFTAIARYAGNSSIEEAVRNTTFTISKIDTTTLVSVINNTVGNVTIAVNVTGQDGSKVTHGQLNVTVDGSDKLYPIAGEETVIKLNITTVEHVDVHVEFIEDETYLNSTGMTSDSVASGSPEEFTGIDADKENVTLVLNVLEDDVDVGRHITIDIRLTDGMGNPITGYVNLTFNGEDEEEVLVNNGHLSYDRATHIAGIVTVNAIFFENATANKATASDSYRINKINTTTIVGVENATVGNVVVVVEVVDKYGDNVLEGNVTVTVNGTSSKHIMTGKYTSITLENVTSMENTYEITVVYDGDWKYNNSTGITRESYGTDDEVEFTGVDIVKQNATLTIGVNQSSIYVFRDITYNGTLVDGLGENITGVVNITVMYGDELVDFRENVPVTEGVYNWTRTSIKVGTINVTVSYGGNENVNPVNASTTYVISRIPTITLVDVLNTTSGNVTIDVSVIDTTITNPEENNVSTGTLRISIPGKTFEVEITDKNTTIPLDITSVKPTTISVKYLENSVYQSSEGLNKTSYEEDPENAEVLSEIVVDEIKYSLTLEATPQTQYINHPVTINGTLLDAEGKPVTKTLIIIDINTDSISTRTNDNGEYRVNYTPEYTGTYNVNATYLGTRTVAEIILNTSFEVIKLNTTTIVSIENNTAGNITLNVTVKDNYNETVKTGIVNVTDDEGNVIGNTTISGQNNYIKLNITGSGDFTIHVKYLENEVYLGSVGLDSDSYNEHIDDPENAEELTQITVEKQTATLTVNTSVPEVYVGHNITIMGTLIDGLGNGLNTTVKIIVNKTEYDNIPVIEGKYNLSDVTPTIAGIVEVNVTYAGNENVTGLSEKITFKVNLKPLNVTYTLSNATLGNTTVNVTAVDPIDGAPINGKVNITLPNGTNVTKDIVNGNVEVPIDVPMPGGLINITVFEVEGFEDATTSDEIVLVKRNSTTNATIVNATAGNVTVRVNITDTTTGKAVTSGNITITAGEVEVARVEFNNETGIVDVVTSIIESGDYEFVVLFEGNTNYTGSQDSGEKLNVNIAKRNATVIYNEPLVNSTLGNTTINVTVVDSTTGEAIVNGIVNVTDNDGNVIGTGVTDEEGNVLINVTVPVGNNNININYTGNVTYNPSSMSESIEVTQRDSTTVAEMINATAGNVTVRVNVTDATTGLPVTSGNISVTAGGVEVARVEFNNETGIVDVLTNITDSSNYEIVAVFEGNTNYAGSEYDLGKQAINKQNATITLNVNETSITVFDGIKFNGTLVDGLNNNIDAKVNITVSNGTDAFTYVDVPVTGGFYEQIRTTNITGTINVTVSYAGNNTINPLNITRTYNVDKRETITLVQVVNDTIGNFVIDVVVKDAVNGSVLTSGEKLIAVSITEGIYNYTINESGVTRITVPVSDNRQLVRIVVDYLGNGTYKPSLAYDNATYTEQTQETLTSVTLKTHNSTLSVEVTPVVDRVGTVFNISGNFVDTNGTAIVGAKLIISVNNSYYNDNVITGEEGYYSVNFTSTVEGNYTVTVKYNGDEVINATVNATTLRADKVFTNTSVRIVNNTQGNVTLAVNVTEVDGTPITSGVLNITVGDKTEQYAFSEEENIISLKDLGLDIDSTTPVSIKIIYTGSNVYVNSTGKLAGSDDEFNQIVADKASAIICVDVDPHNVTIGDIYTIFGNLTDSNANIITGANINITVKNSKGIIYSINVTANDNTGRFTYVNNTLPAGTYTVNASFYDDNYEYTSASVSFTVSKVITSTELSAANTTAGNVTVHVIVTDNKGREVSEGIVNIVDKNGATIATATLNAKNKGVVDIVLKSIQTDGTYTFTANYEGTSKYYESSDDITEDIVTRDMTVVISTQNSTFGNTTVKVNLTDTTTGTPLPNAPFNITDADGNVVGNGTTSADGTAVVNVTVPVGEQTLTVVYPGNDTYNATKETFTIELIKRNSTTKATVINNTAGNVTLRVKVTDATTGKPVTSGNITITANDKQVARVQFNEKSGIVDILTNIIESDDYKFVAIFEGNTNYTGSQDSGKVLNVKIGKRNATIIYNKAMVNNTLGNTTINVTVVDSITNKPIVNGAVNVTDSKGKVVGSGVTDKSGNVLIDVTLPVGSNKININYAGNATYNKCTTSETSNVTKRSSTTKATVINKTAGNVTVEVEVTDAVTGSPVRVGYVNITVNGKSVGRVAVGNDGKAVLNTKINSTGNYTITANYEPSQNYTSSSSTSKVAVQGRKTNITAQVTNSTQGNTTVDVEIKDSVTGEPINGNVTITLPNGTNITAKANNGSVEIPVNLPVGNNTVKITYPGDKTHNSTTVKVPVNVEPRDSSVTVKVVNNTVGNTTVKVTLVDTVTKGPLNGSVIVTLPNGKNVTAKATNGSVTIPVNLPVGNNTIKVTYPGDKNHKPSTENVQVNVKTRDSGIKAKVSNKTAGNTTVTVDVYDPVTGKPITSGYVNITYNGQTVGRAKVDSKGKATIKTNINTTGTYKLVANYEGNANYSASSKTIGNVAVTGRDTKVNVVIDNASVGETKVKITLKDAVTGKVVSGNVTITLPNATKINVEVGKSGTVTIPIDLPAGNGTVKVKYNGDNQHKAKEVTAKYKVSKTPVTVKVDSVVGTIGEDITLIAHVFDKNGKAVNGGNLVFKLNGRTLRMDGRFDTNNTNPMKFQVVNGIVKFTMKADLYLRAGKNITASYSGSYKYLSAKGNTAKANIRKRSAQLTVSVTPRKVKQNTDIVFTITLKDITKNAKNVSSIYTNASIILKVNGVTIKDKAGNNKYIPVRSTVVNYVYHVASGTGAVDKNGNIRNYTVEAVYINSAFYPDTRNKSYFNVEKSIVNINFKKVTVKNNVLSVKANLTDYENKLLVGNSKVCLKINGKTYKQNGKVYYVPVKNGNVDLRNVKIADGMTVKSVTLVSGQRQPYYGARETTTDILTS